MTKGDKDPFTDAGDGLDSFAVEKEEEGGEEGDRVSLEFFAGDFLDGAKASALARCDDGAGDPTSAKGRVRWKWSENELPVLVPFVNDVSWLQRQHLSILVKDGKGRVRGQVRAHAAWICLRSAPSAPSAPRLASGAVSLPLPSCAFSLLPTCTRTPYARYAHATRQQRAQGSLSLRDLVSAACSKESVPFKVQLVFHGAAIGTLSGTSIATVVDMRRCEAQGIAAMRNTSWGLKRWGKQAADAATRRSIVGGTSSRCSQARIRGSVFTMRPPGVFIFLPLHFCVRILLTV